MEIQRHILHYCIFPYMPVDNVIPSKLYEGVVTGFFLPMVFYRWHQTLTPYHLGKVLFPYARGNKVLLHCLIPAHLEVHCSILITKEITRTKFPKG